MLAREEAVLIGKWPYVKEEVVRGCWRGEGAGRAAQSGQTWRYDSCFW